MSLTYAVVALGRPTFDVPYAEARMKAAFAALDAAGINCVGPRDLLFDAGAAREAISGLRPHRVDLLLILQVTFTDATMTVELARSLEVPLAIWALPEPRAGGRLRLNALCGLNLATHALGKAGHRPNWLYRDPEDVQIGPALKALADPRPTASASPAVPSSIADEKAERALAAIQNMRIAVFGSHPDGFDTCAYDKERLKALGNIEVRHVPLGDLFEQAKAVDPVRVANVHAEEAKVLGNLDEMDRDQLDRSLRSFLALSDAGRAIGAKSVAVRCWPEFFTEYGCAACGPVALLNEAMTPAACEADVHGSISQLLLQELAEEPAWMTDLVDVDPEDDTAILWHCGSAPLSMRDPDSPAEATIHTNRKMPLLHQYTIRPGRITLARLSEARGALKLMLGGAEVIRRPMAFTGTSGTIRFDRPASEVLGRILDEGLEHHFAIAYGDHRPALRAVAGRLGLPVLELC